MNNNKAASVLFFVMGIGFFMVSVFLCYNSARVLLTYETAQGTITGFNEKLSEDDDTGKSTLLYAPVYEFTDKLGKKYTVDAANYSSSKSFNSTKAKIYYNKDFPEIAVTGIFQLYIVPLISIFFCTVCLLTAYVVRKPSTI